MMMGREGGCAGEEGSELGGSGDAAADKEAGGPGEDASDVSKAGGCLSELPCSAGGAETGGWRPVASPMRLGRRRSSQWRAAYDLAAGAHQGETLRCTR